MPASVCNLSGGDASSELSTTAYLVRQKLDIMKTAPMTNKRRTNVLVAPSLPLPPSDVRKTKWKFLCVETQLKSNI